MPDSTEGLSPRVRGNLRLRNRARDLIGSIPACAGKPAFSAASLAWTRVYPRACGETVPGIEGAFVSEGLSPRVRGNLFICPERGLAHDKGYYHSYFGADAPEANFRPPPSSCYLSLTAALSALRRSSPALMSSIRSRNLSGMSP